MALFLASAILAIPSIMVVLSLVLKPVLNRWLNIIFGTLFTLMMVLIAVGSLTPWYTFYVFLAVVEAILTAVVVWTAWKWPRQASA